MNHLNYQVLARTTRPTKFSEVIGQEALTQTLKNAIESGRLAHAFILTGTRGVGKTTTARLLARALNCIGEDGQGQPTAEPCGKCMHCVAIAEDRHVDVIEVDAATRTGVDDMRQLMEGISYKPVMGRYKIYIIDEVHMLSKNAFNALLKTLEEPPLHVKLIFATTEIRKVPLTILSRCQRFDLKRIPVDLLANHFKNILEKEKVTFEEEAVLCIARAAAGSARDGLSILEQAIVGAQGGKMLLSQVQKMLGLSDREKIFQLLGFLLKGNVSECLEAGHALYMEGADPDLILQDLLNLIHQSLTFKVTDKNGSLAADLEAVVSLVSAETLMMLWQVLMKGAEELKVSSLPLETLEVILIRAMHVKAITSGEEVSQKPEVSITARQAPQASVNHVSPMPAPSSLPKTFDEVVGLFEKKREPIIADYLIHDVSLVDFKEGSLKLNVLKKNPENLHPRIAKLLSDYTSSLWTVETVAEKGEDPLGVQRQQAETSRKEKVLATDEVKKLVELFPGAQVTVK